jgi:hypothetical protein
MDDNATTTLWHRLARPFRLAETVDALFGLSPEVVAQLAGIRMCTSPEAGRLLAEMPRLSRALTTSVQAAPLRVRGEIRGPVLWSETMSARAASFGDPDLFVCTTPQRDYDTAENRVLVAALSELADGGKAIEHVGDHYDDPTIREARAVARSARLFLDHPALARVSRVRVQPRVLKRVRGSKSAERYRSALAVLEQANEPLDIDMLLPYCDRRTRLQHEVLLAVIEDLESRGMRIPALRVESGSLLAGPITYVHPRRLGARDHLHGILVGDVLIDVPDRLRETQRGRAAATLAARSHGRPAVLVLDRVEVPAAVDFAVRDARDRLAHQPAPAGRDDADRPGGGALQHLRAAGVASLGA